MLPYSYNEDRCFLYPVNPDLLFAYWDFSTPTWDRIAAAPSRPVVLLLCSGGERVRRVEVPKEVRFYYLGGVAPAREYRLEVALPVEGSDEVLMASPEAATPPDRPSELHEPVFLSLSPSKDLPLPDPPAPPAPEESGSGEYPPSASPPVFAEERRESPADQTRDRSRESGKSEVVSFITVEPGRQLPQGWVPRIEGLTVPQAVRITPQAAADDREGMVSAGFSADFSRRSAGGTDNPPDQTPDQGEGERE